jgi:putative ABC transport system substrate-binding protein
VPHVGVLTPGSAPSQALDDFLTGMRELGWIEGGNVVIEVRYGNGDPALHSANAAAVVAEKVDVIVVFSYAQPVRRATATIPIVADSDTIGLGLHQGNLARPIGNVTGISDIFEKVRLKQLQMLKEIAPWVSKIGLLVAHTGNLSNQSYAQQVTKDLEPEAAPLGVSLLPVIIDTVEDLPRLFDEMTAAGAGGYLVIGEPRIDTMRNSIAALALRHRLPGAAHIRFHADAGVLLS